MLLGMLVEVDEGVTEGPPGVKVGVEGAVGVDVKLTAC